MKSRTRLSPQVTAAGLETDLALRDVSLTSDGTSPRSSEEATSAIEKVYVSEQHPPVRASIRVVMAVYV